MFSGFPSFFIEKQKCSFCVKPLSVLIYFTFFVPLWFMCSRESIFSLLKISLMHNAFHDRFTSLFLEFSFFFFFKCKKKVRAYRSTINMNRLESKFSKRKCDTLKWPAEPSTSGFKRDQFWLETKST